MAPEVWAEALGELKAPLGVHAILGNHDWWDDRAAQRTRKGPVLGRRMGQPPIVIILGIEGVGKRTLVRAIASEHGLSTLVIEGLQVMVPARVTLPVAVTDGVAPELRLPM